MRRESVAGLRVRNFSPDWGLRGVPVKGGKTRDIPLPTVVRQYLGQYIDNIVAKEMIRSLLTRRSSGPPTAGGMSERSGGR